MPTRRAEPRPCLTCGKMHQPYMAQLRVRQGQYCSLACSHTAVRSRRIALVCAHCGIAFTRTPGQLQESRGKGIGTYCSRECCVAAWRTTKQRPYRETIRTYGGVELTCPTCGVVFTRSVSVARKPTHAHYCSHACRGIGLRHNPEAWTPPKRRGGHKVWSRAVLRRDKRICQKCGTTEGMMHAHHIVGWARAPHLRLDVDNGITLCAACHLATHSNQVGNASLAS